MTTTWFVGVTGRIFRIGQDIACHQGITLAWLPSAMSYDAIAHLPPFGPKSEYLNVVIETPRGSTAKTNVSQRIIDFFVAYNKLESRQFKPLRCSGAVRAARLVRDGSSGAAKRKPHLHRV
jgi:hypothetical protein